MDDSFHAPLQESLFILRQVLDWRKLFACKAFAHVDDEVAAAVLSEGARFAGDILAPLNRSGDTQGSRLIDGKVVTPDGFKEAYRKFAEAGWIGLDMPQAYGGQNLPLTIQLAFADMVNGACLAFAMLPLMLRAAASLLLAHGSKTLVDKVVPQLVSGKWGATICISEAQAGSDVGRLRCTARLQEDGTYLVSGTKIFITYGDQDFTEQIVHMVLARTPGAPSGTKGISLFLIPKLRFDSGTENNVSVGRVEKKMGLNASPTCVLNLDQATAYRIGEENRGLHCMFTMVNLMRLEVAIQGPAIASAAINKALRYALERQQGGDAENPPSSLINHADIRRMLFIMRARTEAMRALVYETACDLDIARVAEDEQERRTAGYMADFLLPVCKAAGSETGFDVANYALQIFAGHGYIKDTGVEQYVRDARVSMIYEGTNGIQALDLVSRKLLQQDAIRYRVFINRVKEDINHSMDYSRSQVMMKSLETGVEYLENCTNYIIGICRESSRDVEAGASDYLALVALVAGGWMWLRMINSVDETTDFGRSKIAIGNFYAAWLMPEIKVLSERIHTGAEYLDSLDNDSLLNC